MRLLSLRLSSFRAHADSQLQFAEKINVLHGPNGAGKTNVLEAVHYLCLTKSFLTSADAHVLRRDESFLEVSGEFENDRGTQSKVRLAYGPELGKKLFRNGAAVERFADLVGAFPLVILSPADHVLTDGGPEHRRRFLDATLCQARPVYLDDLLTYRRVLKQRNALLLHVKRGGQNVPGTMEAWDEELVQVGARIIVSRQSFLKEFAGFLAEAYRMLNAVGEEPTMSYISPVDLEDAPGIDVIIERFRMKLAEQRFRERSLGRTLSGPHRDEVVFSLGGFEVRPYASQGQHRTVGLALRIATFLYLKDRLEETPLLLLDDVFGTLDAQRAEIVLELLDSDEIGQSIITAARPEMLARHVEFGVGRHREIGLAEGCIVQQDVHENVDAEATTIAAAG